MPVDVLNRDGRIVDKDADGEREAAERHHVDRLAEQRQDRHGGEDRERDRHGDDEGRAPAAEEDQDHEPGQRSGDDAFLDDARNGLLHEGRLIADQAEIEADR